MESENLEVSEQYKKWFNRGYHLRKTMPEVFKGMVTPKNEPKEITEAFEAGRRQFEREYAIESELKSAQENTSRRNQDRGR